MLSIERLEAREVMDASPVGSEFQVNTYTTGAQIANPTTGSAVAMDDAGNYVVVWESYIQDNGDHGIYAQRFTAAGAPIGGEFKLNTYSTGNQSRASIAMSGDGHFVVTWTSEGQDGNETGVFARRYAANGSALDATEFQVNTYTADHQRYSSVAMDDDGDFAIVWQSYYQYDGVTGDDTMNGVYARVYNAAGTPQTGEIHVNTYTDNEQYYASIAMDADGDFVVGWQSAFQDGDGWGVYARRFNAAGVAQGGEISVAETTSNGQQLANVAMDADGDFTVLWMSNGPDGDSYGIYQRRFDAAGTPQTGEVLVSTYTTDYQAFPRVAMNRAGEYIVAWSSNLQDGDGFGVYAQLFDETGAPVGDEFQVNVETAGLQGYPNVAINADGDFMIVWVSADQDGDSYGVYAQGYTPAAVNSPPTDIQLSANSIAEGSAVGTVIGLLTGTDANAGDTLTFTLQADPDGLFAVVGNQLRVNGVLNYETATSHSVTIRVSDGTATYDEQFTINVTNVAPSTPTDSNATANSVTEGAPINTAVNITALSSDGAGTITYSLTNNAGGHFQINATTGVVTTTGTPADFETSGGSYTITVQANDGTSSVTQTFTIAVTNVAPSTPTDSDATANSVTVGAAVGTIVGVTAASTDVAGGAVVYGLTNNAGGRFTINNSTGVVSVASGATFVAGTNYTITVQTTDGTTPSATTNIVINAVAAPAPTPVVTGTSGADSIKVGYKNGAYVIKMNGDFLPTTYPSVSRIEIYGLGGNDTIEIDEAALATFYIDGGIGNDVITGGSGNDMILGGAGNDSIDGGLGRDVLIGGLGKDTIKGATSGTTAANAHLMIGDSTDHDSNQTALLAIAAAWSANDGSTNATVRSYFSSSTVHGDGQADAIKSNAAINDLIFSFELKTGTTKLDDLTVQAGDTVN